MPLAVRKRPDKTVHNRFIKNSYKAAGFPWNFYLFLAFSPGYDMMKQKKECAL